VGLSWQQGPLSTGAIGRFLVAEPLPNRLLYVESLRGRMRVRFGGIWIAAGGHVLLLFEPGRYPVAYFPETDVSPHTLERTDHATQHPDLGLTSWYSVQAGERIAPRGDHRIDIRQASRNLVVRHRDRIIADTKRPIVLYESGFAPRWYVPRADIDESGLTPVKLQTFCPYKGLCSYYTIGDARLAAWSYPDAYPEVGRISNLVSFEPELVSVHLDGTQLHLEPGQEVIPHGPDRNLTVAELARPANSRESVPAGPAAAASG
jgi:uncharacterized protein (DUF427 family)